MSPQKSLKQLSQETGMSAGSASKARFEGLTVVVLDVLQLQIALPANKLVAMYGDSLLFSCMMAIL
jgi:hypothetical protein